MKYLIPLSLVVVCFFAASASAQGISTIAKILTERDTQTANVKSPKYCSGGVFKPCVCASDVTKRIMYRPAVRECGGNAAVILFGPYLGAFSAVLRNVENADRIPNPKDLSQAMVNGCSRELADSAAPPNRCSLFKAQKVIRAEDSRGAIAVHCMGAAGSSVYGRKARRITVKLSDSPNSSNDPLVRACLGSPLKDLN